MDADLRLSSISLCAGKAGSDMDAVRPHFLPGWLTVGVGAAVKIALLPAGGT